MRLACWFWRPAKSNFQNIVFFLYVRCNVGDGSCKSAARLFPMKNLAGIKCHPQIKIGRCKLG